MKKLALLVAVIILISSFPLTAIASFEASEPANWAKEADTYLRTYQLIPDELFSDYDAPIKRDEFAAVLIGIYNEACQNYYTFPDEVNPFIDTMSNKYLSAIKKAYIMGIVNGTSATTFSPDNNITREDTATLIHRFIMLMYPQEGTPLNKTIADRSQIADYAVPSVEFCMSNGIMNGIGNDMFYPKGLLTRQEAMVLMHNICNRYKVVENGRGAAISNLTPILHGLHEMVFDGYLYIRVQGYPFSFNNTVMDSSIQTLIRTPLDQSKKNQGEILFSHVDEISAYTVNQDNIFFCDRSLNRAVYSTDKDGKNIKLLYNLSKYNIGDFSYMHVEGDWLFVGAGGCLFKMRTDGTCLSILHRGGITLHAEGKYLYIQDIYAHDKYQLIRTSIHGDKTELIYSHENLGNSWAGGIFYNSRFYIAITEQDMNLQDGVPLIEVDIDTKEVKKIHTYSWYSESIIAGTDGIYVSSINQNKVNLKSISGGTDISFGARREMGRGYGTKYGNYFYFSAVGAQPYTRYYYLYNIETGALTDGFGNTVN